MNKLERIDLTGKRFGNLVAISLVNGEDKWNCQCDCGKTHITSFYRLIKSITKSCGCLKRSVLGIRTKKHGLTNTKEHELWKGMNQRCVNPKHISYPNYHKKNITVCEGWKNSFESFFADMGVRPNENLTLDRIKNDLGYNCGHCDYCIKNGFELNVRWATWETQNINKEEITKVIFKGVETTLIQLSREYNINRQTLSDRLKAGLDLEVALTLGNIHGQNYNQYKNK